MSPQLFLFEVEVSGSFWAPGKAPDFSRPIDPEYAAKFLRPFFRVENVVATSKASAEKWGFDLAKAHTPEICSGHSCKVTRLHRIDHLLQ
jgi:hypothetical protein